MTSATIGLPDRYRPLDQIGPDEPTPTGVIRCWRAKDRVLNRDVAIRVHTPAGPAAHAWITRALTAGGLATPALAMVYDASEGSGDPNLPGGAAYVVNEWIDGETLADRLTRGPLPERELRTILRRLAEGVAEAHRVGLAVGGLTPENVVLRPNGLVGLRAVPAATGSIEGDISALGALLEACLTGHASGSSDGAPDLSGPPDLVALARRARSSEPGRGLTSVAAMAALLGERPRAGASPSVPIGRDDSDGNWLRRLRERRADAEQAPAAPLVAAPAVPAVGTPADGAPADGAPPTAIAPTVPPAEADAPPVKLNPHTLPPVPAVRPVPPAGTPVVPGATGGDTVDVSAVPPAGPNTLGNGYDDGPFGVFTDRPTPDPAAGDPYPDRPLADTWETPVARRRLAVVGLPLLALAVVIALAWWFGSNVLSVAGSVDQVDGSTPSQSSSAPPTSEAPDGAAITVISGDVFDPFGDGEPENNGDVPLSFDGDPATGWSTLTYRGSPAFGNLKPGVGVLYDLGSPQPLKTVTLTTSRPGATVEIRTGDAADGQLDSYPVAATGTLEGTTDLAIEKPVTAQYVLVWVTGLVDTGEGFSADIAEVSVQSAG